MVKTVETKGTETIGGAVEKKVSATIGGAVEKKVSATIGGAVKRKGLKDHREFIMLARVANGKCVRAFCGAAGITPAPRPRADPHHHHGHLAASNKKRVPPSQSCGNHQDIPARDAAAAKEKRHNWNLSHKTELNPSSI